MTWDTIPKYEPLAPNHSLDGSEQCLNCFLQTFHRGCRLNDNLDGTFSVLKRDESKKPPVVISQALMDFERIAVPLKPTYPYGPGTKTLIWVPAVEGGTADGSPPPPGAQVETSPDIEPDDIVSDVGINLTADGRPYREWWGRRSRPLCVDVGILIPTSHIGETGELKSMAGALIPQGYELDATLPHRPWICPIRSCRILCRNRRALGYHFIVS